jgi:ABC-type polar amino acid transport system ATPase subunit
VVIGLNKKTTRDMAMALIDRVGLTDKHSRQPDQLSGGKQERAADLF